MRGCEMITRPSNKAVAVGRRALHCLQPPQYSFARPVTSLRGHRLPQFGRRAAALKSPSHVPSCTTLETQNAMFARNARSSFKALDRDGMVAKQAAWVGASVSRLA